MTFTGYETTDSEDETSISATEDEDEAMWE